MSDGYIHTRTTPGQRAQEKLREAIDIVEEAARQKKAAEAPMPAYDRINRAAADMGHQFSQVDRESPFTRVGIAANEVASLAYRTEELVARLVGPQPEEASSTGGPTPAQPGHLHDLTLVAENIISNVNRMQRLLTALERMLP